MTYRSTDAGDTWSALAGGLVEEPQALAISTSNPPMVFTGTSAGGVYKNASMLTLNRREYCVGDSWNASILNLPGDAAIRLVGVSNGVQWVWPGWSTTENDGHFTATGTFGNGSQGNHSFYVQIAGINSNVVSQSISNCR
jgi:hypothetical protein